MTAPAPHDITLVIPVADRPRHLSDCLHTLLELKRRYPYAGKVMVLVAEDSRDASSIEQHRAIAASVTAQGIAVHHLGPDAQRALVDSLPAPLRMQLAGIIGDGGSYAHKGASITRNIAYLWLRRQVQDGRRQLIWFLDSDQEFRVNLATAAGEEEQYAVDYLNGLDQIFSTTPVRILTGKVVGDPPVSPAVMAGNFLDDVMAFLADMARCTPQAPCTFHTARRPAADAAYHDMADMFGFKAPEAFRYHCHLRGAHDHVACFIHFAARLARFFDGEHPTRRSVYQPAELLGTLTPARTIYTGNYVFTPDCLDYFIPFAGLRLRMAGPTLGRIIKAELGAGFVSANLPMLHRRTVEGLGQSEFRPGIERAQTQIDLSGEFERQYFGDVMLFSMERLTALGYPAVSPAEDELTRTVGEVEAQMHARYGHKHQQIVAKIAQLRSLYESDAGWWQQRDELAGARQLFGQFIANMQHNFGDEARAWQQVNDLSRRQARTAAIIDALRRYPEDRNAWRSVLGQAFEQRGDPVTHADVPFPQPSPLPEGKGI
ncbi:hypothetical protein [Sulfurivermis fontis]|uniref:hypothetical protein n=1 Tax=Sulfurivermis fontis TaxID=1972068 RepID=UPI000FDCBB88|nr:hypothetical protein [Sulfurivermis fontis]